MIKMMITKDDDKGDDDVNARLLPGGWKQCIVWLKYKCQRSKGVTASLRRCSEK